MTSNRKIGVAIVLVCTLAAAAGLISGFLSREVAVGIAVIGIVIGTAVARGRFSDTSNATKQK